MRYLILVLFAFTIASCSSEAENEKKNKEKELIPYDEFLKQIPDRIRSAEDQQALLFDVISNDIPDYWIGTKWDFNGTTREPGNGKIACGYFVTNILDGIGIEIDRIRLAQEPSSVMINELTINVKHTGSFDVLKEYLLSHSEKAVFIIGLDFHTGFITKDGNKLWFIHSNYIGKQGVVKESIEHSKALNASNSYMVGCLSCNDAIIRIW